MVVLALMVTAPASTSVADSGEVDGHPAIVIVRDEGPTGFVLGHHPVTGTPLYRPGSGVVAGNGTPSDPYVIEGWRTSRIVLVDTTAHVVVQGNVVEAGGPLDDEALLLDGVRNVTVRDNTLRGGEWTLRAVGSQGVTIEGNDVVTTRHVGILLHRVHDSVVRGNRVTAAGDDTVLPDGIRLQSATGNRVEGNSVLGLDEGIVVLWGSRNALRDNRVEDALIGLSLEGADRNRVASNRLVDVLFSGLQVVEADGNLLDGNRVTGNRSGDIYVAYSDGNRFVGNVVDVNASHHVDVFWSPNTTLEGNHFAHTHMEVAASPYARIHGNDLRDSFLKVRSGSTAGLVEGNRLVGGGISVASSEGLLVRLNNVTDARVGLVASGPNLTIEKNEFHGGNVGMTIRSATGGVVAGNRFTEGAWYGLRVDGSAGLWVTGNTMTGYGFYGAWVTDSDDILVEGNLFESNGQHGARVLRASNVSLLQNAFSKNGEAGAHVQDSRGTRVYDSNLVDNVVAGVAALGSAVDAAHNWWGCIDGPAHAACDGVSGDVDYEPWLTSPAEKAGA